jgi:hypothetical protein
MNYQNYMNTVNYSTIPSSGYRFVTYCWKCNTGYQTIQYTQFIFNINGISGNFSISPSPNYSPQFDNVPMLIYYRTEDVNNVSTFNAAHKNSVWIDATSTSYPINNSNYYDVTGQIYSSKNALSGRGDIPLYSNNTLTVTANAISSFNVNSMKNYNIYLRIGLPMASNCKFSNVTCTIR